MITTRLTYDQLRETKKYIIIDGSYALRRLGNIYSIHPHVIGHRYYIEGRGRYPANVESCVLLRNPIEINTLKLCDIETGAIIYTQRRFIKEETNEEKS